MNAFTSESRDTVLSVNLRDLCTRLRAPESIARLIHDWKPQTTGLGDHILKTLLDSYLLTCIVGGRYREIQATLDALFGRLDYDSPLPTTVETAHGRSPRVATR